MLARVASLAQTTASTATRTYAGALQDPVEEHPETRVSGRTPGTVHTT